MKEARRHERLASGHLTPGLEQGALVPFEARHVAAKHYAAEELGYDPQQLAAVSRRVRNGEHPGLVIHQEGEVRWYVFVGDERAEERGSAELEWWTLGELTDPFPALGEVFRSEAGAGTAFWEWDAGRGFYRPCAC